MAGMSLPSLQILTSKILPALWEQVMGLTDHAKHATLSSAWNGHK